MKRSEMIDEIEDFLLNFDWYGDDAPGDKLLKIIEKAGMLPPCNFKESPKDITMRNIECWAWEKE